MPVGDHLPVFVSWTAGAAVRHDIFITVAWHDDKIHFVVDCSCGKTLTDVGCEMISISLDHIENVKWKHLAEYAPKTVELLGAWVNYPGCICSNPTCQEHGDDV